MPSTNPGDVTKTIKRYFGNEESLFNRMHRDYEDYWTLEEWEPDLDDYCVGGTSSRISGVNPEIDR